MKRKTLFCILVLVLLCAGQLYAHDPSDQDNVTQTVINNGVGLGSVIAVVASWSRNSSILWAILHGLFSWFYVVYFAVTRDAK
ncbi:hypothetical protein TH63_12865 [Rufibacter radiotolerans]|uniref:Uncharacterized protein n=1 Tax=Rufibacter radiotolerans TaxID=1379910 RepID=A0A0H4W7A0_9BACT|nr:hypothetical protein [Rufibacter radiotolerans]AKQ46311.1 hypothetical protein TH63_12865 [Rufibacter radiotolerans]